MVEIVGGWQGCAAPLCSWLLLLLFSCPLCLFALPLLALALVSPLSCVRSPVLVLTPW